MKYHTRSYSGHGSVPKKQRPTFPMYCGQNKKCHNGRHGDDPADFSQIPAKFSFIIAKSRCMCAIVNLNVVNIDPIMSNMS